MSTESFLNVSMPSEIVQVSFSYSNLVDDITYYIVFSLSIVGIIGNGISIAILRKHDIAQTSNILLLALSVNDLLFCITQCLKKIKKLFSYYPGFINYSLLLSVNNIFRISTLSTGPILLLISVVLTCVISIERLIAVCFPFHVARIFTSEKVKYFIITIYIFFLILSSPIFLRSSIVWEYSDLYNTTVATEKFSDIYVENRYIIDTYLVLVISNISTIVLLGIILLSTVIISIKLICRQRRNVSSQETVKSRVNKNKIIKMLLTMCFITFLSVLTTSITEGIMTNFTDEEYYGYVGQSLRLIDYLLYQLNPSTNFIIYFCMSKKFRNEYKKIFRFLWCKQLM